MEKELILCDTNIFISWFNNDIKTIKALEALDNLQIGMSTITAMELLQGMGNKRELTAMKKKIAKFGLIDFDSQVSDLAYSYIERFSLSHRLQIPDSIIAATSVAFGFQLFTYNTKDFNYIPDIQLYNP